jgi:quercetin dioxygenase-like cupin family protein
MASSKPNVVRKPPTTEPISEPGEIVDLQPLEAALGMQRNTLFVKTGNVKVIQLIIPAGANVPTHEAQGEIIVHCMEGRATLTALGEAHELNAGQLLYLRINEPFSIHGIEDTSLLVTIISAKRGSNVELIGE